MVYPKGCVLVGPCGGCPMSRKHFPRNAGFHPIGTNSHARSHVIVTDMSCVVLCCFRCILPYWHAAHTGLSSFARDLSQGRRPERIHELIWSQ
jgi:hypothetical protein